MAVRKEPKSWSWPKVPLSQEAPKQGKPFKTVGHLKMQVIPDLKSKTITETIKEQLEPSVELTTDDFLSYIKLNEYVHSHQTVAADKNTIKTFLPWVHITISNTKRLLSDVHYRLKN